MVLSSQRFLRTVKQLLWSLTSILDELSKPIQPWSILDLHSRKNVYSILYSNFSYQWCRQSGPLYLLLFEIKSCEYEILCHVWLFLFGVKKLNIRKSQDVFPVPNMSVGLLIQPPFSVICQTTKYECGQGAWEYSAGHLYWHGILFMSHC